MSDRGPTSRVLHPPGHTNAAATGLSSATGRPKRSARRVLTGLALGAAVLLLVTAGAGYALYRRYDGNITRIAGITRALPGVA